MKSLLLVLSCLVVSCLSLPRDSNDLTCSICVDVVTDIDQFITEDTTIQQIMDFAKQVIIIVTTQTQPTYLKLKLT